MSTSHRICETCVYCSFAGNCDRYNKPLTSIEQPACDAYEIHPLLAENVKLRNLCEWLLNPYRLGAVTGEGVDRQWCRETYDGGSHRLRELGIEVER